MRLWTILLVGLLSLASTALLHAEPGVHHVPYRLTPVYHLVVRVKINGAGPLNFIVDTGCNVVILTPSGCKQIELPTNTPLLKHVEIEGGVVIKNNRVNINTPAQLSLLNRNNAGGGEIHGVIGYDILRHYRIELDYSTHKMIWTHVSALPAEKQPAAPNAIVVPFEVSGTGHMIVAVKLNGRGPYRYLYDTGAPGNVVSPAAGVGGREAIIGSLEMGELTAEKVPVFVQKPPNFDRVEGIIGFPLIARYRTIMDFKENKLTFLPGSYQVPRVTAAILNGVPGPQPKKVLPEKGAWGLLVQSEFDDKPGVGVAKVLPDSPGAAAGFKVYDRLLVLDDAWIDTLADYYNAVSRLRPDSAVTAIVERGGQRLTLKTMPK